MKKSPKKTEEYQGFEQGPIRPPSESSSLLIRVTRNCPWNRCTFCPVYKGSTFSLRPVEHVIEDINTVHHYLDLIKNQVGENSTLTTSQLAPLTTGLNNHERMAMSAAMNWIRSGMRSVFLQDANSLIIKPDNLIHILKHLRSCFPWIERITSYARSHTICRIKDDKLAELHSAGLNRIHIGMESGSNKVLALVKKGSTKEDHIKAGLKVKRAGMELSEYIMPGLGGRELSSDHALETADTLNTINADFIRLRTLAIPNHVELYQQYSRDEFTKQTDIEVTKEILLFLQNLKGITSTLKSDHILNLFEEIRGRFPEDKEKMMEVITKFLQLPRHEQMLYQVGRRTGIITKLDDLNNPAKRAHAESSCARFDITPDNVNEAIEELMKRFI
jgi:radical SAM superfamily enzyme YgiQ (UPF0313 family)